VLTLKEVTYIETTVPHLLPVVLFTAH